MSFDPIALDAARKRFWSRFWEETVEDAVVEYRMDKIKIGPLVAFLAAGLPGDPAVNFVLGADMPGALEGGRLDDAVAWLESHRAELRIPVLSGSGEAAAAEARLEALGQAPSPGPALLMRNVAPLRFSVPPEINVHEHVSAWEAEVLCDFLAGCLGLPSWLATTVMGLCEAEDWHCYSAATEEEMLSYAMVAVGSEVAMIALASVSPGAGAHAGNAAVLQRCIADAAAAGCGSIAVADAGCEPDREEWDSLIEAGFESVGAYVTWRPPVRTRT